MNKKYLLAVVASTLMFAACGDDVTEVNEIHQDGMAVLEAGEKLSKQACDTTNVGEMLFVIDSSAAFVCDGKSWQTLKGEKGGKGDPGKDGVDGADGKDGVDGKDGADGVDGKDGEKGEKGAKGDKGDTGASCSVARNTANDGVTVTCGETSVEIKDGVKGDKGDKGDAGANCSVARNTANDGVTVTCGETSVDIKDGVGCTLDDEGDGTVKVTCGEGDNETITNIYKAVCGAKPYDPAKSFCSDDELFSCDDKPYDPKKQYCLEVTRDGSDIYSVEALLTDARDKQIYKTVEICNNETSTCQTWMAENLNYSVNPNVQSWCGGGSGATEGDCSVYGRLYTWAAAVGKSEDECGDGHECDLSDAKNEKGEVRGVCPEGWHLPSNVEWKALFTAVGGTSYAGQKLKADSDLWNEGTSNDDSFGFAVLPAGRRYDDGSFNYAGDRTLFWSSTGYGSNDAYYWYFRYDFDYVGYYWNFKDYGFSVRCLRD